MNNENLGPAERIIGSLLAYSDHAVHNRPGIVVPDGRFSVGVRWEPVTHKVEGDPAQKVVYRLVKAGKKTERVRAGVLGEDSKVRENGAVVGEYRPAGLFPEVVEWMYRNVAEVWKLDNEFAARWASYSFGEEHRDLKVVLAAFMLVQSRRGDPVLDAGKIAFHDEDFRDVGEAMLLTVRKDDRGMNAKLLYRVRDILSLPAVAAINRELGFGRSARKPFLGRWDTAVEKWLRYREENPKLLQGLVKAGFKQTVMDLCRAVGYKPESPNFFKALGWRQDQAKDGRRTVAVGREWEAAETWDGQDEEAICRRIAGTKPSWKVIVGRVPASVGITRAIMAVAVESGCLSSKDLIIATPTLEDLGLLQVQEVRERWERACREADDMRAANIATRVKSKDVQEALQGAADTAVKAAVEEATRDMRVYFMVDISGSMEQSIAQAKVNVAKFLQAFPADRVHVSVFNTAGREVVVKHASAAGVENAFRGIVAGGGTDYGAGVRALQHHRPTPGESVVFFFVGDEEANAFTPSVLASTLGPEAFGFLKVRNSPYSAVRDTAKALGIPCFMVDENTFSDPYAIPRTIKNLIAATPVNRAPDRPAPTRVTLVEKILKTPVLAKPAWAA
jgi:hypothetical protein